MDRQQEDPQAQDQTEPELPLVTPAFDPLTEPELPLQESAQAVEADATAKTADGSAPAEVTAETKPGNQAEPPSPLGTEALQATVEAEPKAARPMQKETPSWAEPDPPADEPEPAEDETEPKPLGILNRLPLLLPCARRRSRGRQKFNLIRRSRRKATSGRRNHPLSTQCRRGRHRRSAMPRA